MTIKEFKQAVYNAQEEANKFANVDDVGSCNLDCVLIRLPEGIYPQSLRKWTNEYGRLMVERAYGFGQGLYHVRLSLHVMASRNTRMAEATRKSLESNGIWSTVWYQMD